MPAKSPYKAHTLARARNLLVAASTIAMGAWANPALAQCVDDGSGVNVTCSGTSGPYSNGNTGVTVTAQSGGTVTGPMVIGPTATVKNSGTFNGAAGSPALTVGTNSTVNNLAGAVLSQTNSTAGSETVVLGDYSTLNNSGTLTAVTGANVARFGKGGTFVNNASAPVAVTGNIVFGPSLGADISRFTNLNTAFGVVGNVSASGNLNFDNAGIFTGSVIQQPTLGTVNFTNETGGTFTGAINTGDTTVLVNNGTMTLNTFSALGTANAAGTIVTNNGTLNVGSATTPATLSITGNFVQASTGTLGMTIKLPGTLGPVAGTNYSQVFATGTASLGGILALNVTSGYYPTNSVYNVVVGGNGITGDFSSITGNQLTFIKFVPLGIVTLGGTQQAYQLQVQRTSTYAAAIAPTATPNQVAVATGFQGLVATADANPGSDAAVLVGGVDVLSAADAQTFFESVNPAGYVAYANSMRDHTNLFQRKVALRMTDQNSDHNEHGWWANVGGQLLGGKADGTDKTRATSIDAAAGYDYSSPTYVVGAAFGYSRGTLKSGRKALTGNDNAYQIGAYGGLTFGPLTANAQLTYQLGNMQATKAITIGTGATLGTATRTANASANEHLLTGTATLGAKLVAAGVAVTPFVGIETQQGSIKGFTETNAGSADLTVGSISANRTDLLAGATLTASKGHFRPYVRGTYRSLIGTAPSSAVTAYFNADPTTSFTVNGLSAAKHETDVDAGVNIVFDDEGGLFIGYQGTFRDDMTNHGVAAGIRLEF